MSELPFCHDLLLEFIQISFYSIVNEIILLMIITLESVPGTNHD